MGFVCFLLSSAAVILDRSGREQLDYYSLSRKFLGFFCVTYFSYFVSVAITEAANVTIDQFSFDPDVSCKDTVYRDVVRIFHVGEGFKRTLQRIFEGFEFRHHLAR